MPSDPDWLAKNLALWDERVPIHTASAFYDVEGFKAGRDALRPFEIEEVGPVDGLQLVHLQCHFGLDTLDWARRGARATGLDFSPAAVEMAAALARELGIDARFVVADVYHAVEALGRTYDVVYTGLGAINWLPDIRRWADVVASLVRPGGILYLAEFHPFTHVFGESDLTVTYPYFTSGPLRWDEPGTYADSAAPTAHNVSYEWSHGLGEVVTALVEAGLTIEVLREYDYTLYPRWPFLVRDEIGYRFPEGLPSLPLMYSLRARQPL